jgi:hypothetical protein
MAATQQHPALESYLNRLDRALAAVSVGDRAEIVTEIKSHALSAIERDPSAKMEDILESLGEPESVANRYLLERGLKPGRPSRHPVVKWLVVGFLGTIGLFTLGIIVLVWKFTPIIRIDEKNERVTILGGLIDIDGKKGSFKAGDLSMGFDESAKRMTGSKPLDPKKYDEVAVPFGNGKMEVRGAADDVFRWDCRLGGEESVVQPNMSFSDRAVLLDLSKPKLVSCELWVPKGVSLKLNGGNGRVKLLRPNSFVSVELANGAVDIDPDPALNYRYELKATNGKVDHFESSDATDAIPISVRIANGKIEHEAGDAYGVEN